MVNRMKKKLLLFNSLLFFILANMFLSCLNDRRMTIIVENGKEFITSGKVEFDNDLNFENEIITQTIQALVDSLDSRIKLNIGKDYVNL